MPLGFHRRQVQVPLGLAAAVAVGTVFVIARRAHRAGPLAATTPPHHRAEPSLDTLDAWVARAPDDACTWVLDRPADERLAAATALLIAASEQPGLATRLARRLCAEDRMFVREHGQTLIAALGAHGRFDAAVAFAGEGGPERLAWLHAALAQWAHHDPRAAAQAALAQPGGDGLPQVAAVWAARDPAELATFAVDSLAGVARMHALTAALPAWLARDPAALATWLEQFEANPAFDASLAALARLPEVVAHHPDVAFEWAAAIVDDGTRRDTLAAVIRGWAETDPTATRRHLASAPELTADERAQLRALLDRPPD